VAGGHAAELAARIRECTDAPIVFGVGISTPEQTKAVAEVADGVIVGSALVRRVLEAEDADRAEDSLRSAVTDLAAALR
jgi:tryptophan synthase alpha subunit